MKITQNENMAIYRRRLGMSQGDMAAQLDVTQPFIVQVENGVKEIPPGWPKFPSVGELTRIEQFWVMLRRIGVGHYDYRQEHMIRARDWNKWLAGTEPLPDKYFDDVVRRVTEIKPSRGMRITCRGKMNGSNRRSYLEFTLTDKRRGLTTWHAGEWWRAKLENETRVFVEFDEFFGTILRVRHMNAKKKHRDIMLDAPIISRGIPEEIR